MGCCAAVSFVTLLPLGNGAEGELRLRREGLETLVQILGDEDDDWRLQTTADLVTWTDMAGVSPLLSGELTNAPVRSLGVSSGPFRLYRAQRTDGLYDPTLLRTFSLTFTQANWQTLLTSARTTGSNVLASLTLDNGAVVAGDGAAGDGVYGAETASYYAGTKVRYYVEARSANTAKTASFARCLPAPRRAS